MIRKSPKIACLCCAVLALLFFGSIRLRAESAVGVVSRVTGTARVARADATLDVSEGTVVLSWDRLTAEAQSSLTITLNRGGTIDLEGPLQFVVDVSDKLATKSLPDELLRKISGQRGMSTFRASAMGLRAERQRLAFESLGAFSSRLHAGHEYERVGNVLKVTGTAHVTKAASITLVHEGMPLDAGDALTTDTGAFVILAMNHEGSIELGERTQLTAGTLADMGSRRLHFRLMAGSACLTLSKDFLNAWPRFSVLTPNAEVRVKAQKVRLTTSNQSATSDGQSTTVTVAQGTTAVSNPRLGEQIVELGSGYETVVHGTQAPSSPKPIVSTELCRH